MGYVIDTLVYRVQYQELVCLPYFNDYIIDAMYNLLLGTTKHWLALEKYTRSCNCNYSDFEIFQIRANKMKEPALY